MIKIAIGMLLGAALVLGVTSSRAVAPRYSAAIYDCGIRIGKNVTGGIVSGFTIKDHDIGICVDGGASEISLLTNVVD